MKLKANQTSYVAFKLFWGGSGNYEYTPIFISLIPKISTFFDVGSSIGYFSLLAAKVNPRIRVEAFEPSLGAMIFLSENIKINQLESQISVHHLALSDREGQIDFYEIRNPKYPNIYNLSGEHNLGTKKHLPSKKIRVNSQTLDSFVKNEKFKSVDLLKIDTEGSEDLILNSGSDTIRNHNPIIISELLFNRIEGKLEETMTLYGYEFYTYKDQKLMKVETLRRERDNGIRDVFFVHPSKKYLIEEFL